MNLGVLLLAAGASQRMGRPKLLLPWGEGTVLRHLHSQWSSLEPRQLVIIHGPGDAPGQPTLAAELDALGWPVDRRLCNPNPERGMFSSIQAGAGWAGWLPGLTHWAILLGDQPLVRTGTLRQLLEFAARHPDQPVQPSRQGRGRHPVLLPAPWLRQLAITPAATLKEFLASSGQAVARWESTDPGLDLDLDEPADYERALALRAEQLAVGTR